MSDILILITGYQPIAESDDIRITGVGRCTAMGLEHPEIEWATDVAPGALAATINAAIKAAAIDAADLRGYTVGLLDKKTLLGGAVGL